jgi:hypothetical protein
MPVAVYSNNPPERQESVKGKIDDLEDMLRSQWWKSNEVFEKLQDLAKIKDDLSPEQKEQVKGIIKKMSNKIDSLHDTKKKILQEAAKKFDVEIKHGEQGHTKVIFQNAQGLQILFFSIPLSVTQSRAELQFSMKFVNRVAGHLASGEGNRFESNLTNGDKDTLKLVLESAYNLYYAKTEAEKTNIVKDFIKKMSKKYKFKDGVIDANGNPTEDLIYDAKDFLSELDIIDDKKNRITSYPLIELHYPFSLWNKLVVDPFLGLDLAHKVYPFGGVSTHWDILSVPKVGDILFSAGASFYLSDIRNVFASISNIPQFTYDPTKATSKYQFQIYFEARKFPFPVKTVSGSIEKTTHKVTVFEINPWQPIGRVNFGFALDPNLVLGSWTSYNFFSKSPQFGVDVSYSPNIPLDDLKFLKYIGGHITYDPKRSSKVLDNFYLGVSTIVDFYGVKGKISVVVDPWRR